MPSRRSAVLIVAFWLAVTGYVGYRDVWPVVFASGPPPVAIDLADEAARNTPVRWTVHWNGKKSGWLTTRTQYVEADDTFRFTSEYRSLRFEFGPIALSVPYFQTTVRVTRAGDLREQTAEGRLKALFGKVEVADATVSFAGTVADGTLSRGYDGSYSLAGKTRSFGRALDPVPVPAGQPLNPTQPVDRLTGVRPGRRWAVHESDPLDDVLKAVVKEFGAAPPERPRGHLIGEVLSDTQPLEWDGKPVVCRVIEYRRGSELEVRTWVREADGKVLKQEAFRGGENLSVERDK